jgi:hypothetical protein
MRIEVAGEVMDKARIIKSIIIITIPYQWISENLIFSLEDIDRWIILNF